MKYVKPAPNPSGAYPAPQSTPFKGAVFLTEEQAEVVLQYNGFVTITAGQTGASVSPNLEAWEAWKASLPPEPEPEPLQEYVTYGELAAAIREGVNGV